MTGFAEIRKDIVWTLIAVAAFALSLLMPYLEGRCNSWWTIPPLLPADVVPWLLLFVCCCVLFARFMKSIFSKGQRVAKASMFAAGVLLLWAHWRVKPAELFHRGFTQYARTVLTVDEWREISRFAQGHLKPGEWFDALGRGDLGSGPVGSWSEDRTPWSQITAATQIRRLNPYSNILVRPEATIIEWGGALVGHRSVIILTHKGDSLPEAAFGGYDEPTFIADDIVTVVTSD